jgi:hypothetical protein
MRLLRIEVRRFLVPMMMQLTWSSLSDLLIRSTRWIDPSPHIHPFVRPCWRYLRSSSFMGFNGCQRLPRRHQSFLLDCPWRIGTRAPRIPAISRRSWLIGGHRRSRKDALPRIGLSSSWRDIVRSRGSRGDSEKLRQSQGILYRRCAETMAC